MKNRLHIATPGMTYTTNDKKVAEKLADTGNFLLIKIYYLPHKKWEFWKKKKPISYELMCIKDLEV